MSQKEVEMSAVATPAVEARVVSITPSPASSRFGVVEDGFFIESSGHIRNVRATILADGDGHEFKFDAGE
jgi:hypothetical protein